MPSPDPIPQFDPIPAPGAVVAGPHVRFTLLTDRLIRMEHSPNGRFEDRPSQVFWFRRQPVPPFRSCVAEDAIEIETEYLHLKYTPSRRGFTPQTLQVEVKATGALWRYGEAQARSANLKGTGRTLDEAVGRIPLEPGLMARAGWSIVDDSHTLVFNEAGWLEARSEPDNADVYFFGYGRDYPACLQGFCKVAGPPPLIPRWALGNWWSRYWKYSAGELLHVVEEFKEHEAPLSVCIIDMDWHLTETGNTSSGWTGYTWNKKLFPDPQAFLRSLHAYHLKTALNLHPAEGIHPHEEQYQALAKAMQIDPGTHDPIPFDPADPHFMQAYFELLHHPLETQGVDFWWLDWQQGLHTRLPGLDPLWWLNHLHFYNLMRDGVKRPFVFSRWGGLGNHRYPIGFSGDTIVGWEALDFQPYFTATAANVGYGWWSHDIGGHMSGIEDDELYARWVQFGVFSPILRLHSTNNPFHERRPWGRGLAAERPAVSALRLRHALIPYLYSMAWRNTRTSLPLITPLYYTHPERDEAYTCPQEYWFGSELVAAPFTSPAGAETRLARQVVWLPEMDVPSPTWFDFFTGEPFVPGWRAVYGRLEDIPVFARAGAIVPLGPENAAFGASSQATLRLKLFPGADNRFELYEDDGETLAYQSGKFALTPISQRWGGNRLELKIGPVQGDPSQIPAERAYLLQFFCIRRPEQIEVHINGRAANVSALTGGASDQANTWQVTIGPLPLKASDELVVRLSTSEDSLLARPEQNAEKLHAFLNTFRLESYLKQQIEREWPEIASGKRPLQSYRGLGPAHIQALGSLLQP